MNITIAHSPDADDAFMFYGLASKKVGSPGIIYTHVLRDIQTLNEYAREGRYEVTALSVHAYAHVADKYLLLRHGASMGEKDYGPIVVAREPYPIEVLAQRTIAIPGALTTAALILQLALPNVKTTIMPFDRILPAVAEGKIYIKPHSGGEGGMTRLPAGSVEGAPVIDAGLLIHEGQLTYEDAGLHNVLSLHKWWYDRHRLPLPLGVNAIRRDLDADLRRQISADIRASIEYALAHREEALAHCQKFARDLPSHLIDRFVGMYVNDRTIEMKEEEMRAIQTLLDEGYNAGIVPTRASCLPMMY